MQTSEVLNTAADLIQERGWTKGQGWIMPDSPQGAPLCLEGGIQAAMGITPMQLVETNMDELWECSAYTAVSDYLETHKLFRWNDSTATSPAEVIEVLRAAAVIEAAREQELAGVSA